MPVLLLRHEERNIIDTTFKVNLTKKGKERSETTLKDKLLELEIDEIYSSPFIRCLQTIQPFTLDSNIKINVDYSLQELFINPLFICKSYAKLNVNEQKIYNINYDYKSLIPPNTLKFLELPISKSFVSRVTCFYKTIIEPNLNSSKNILVCTHKAVINYLISLLKNEQNIFCNNTYGVGEILKLEDVVKNK
jgi:broad specificity phosphatase PhoE